MALRINTNVASINALNSLARTDKTQQTTLERLSTGLRINRASDDPSGFVISEKLRAQVSSLDQAVENSQNASNLLGTAEAALNEVNNLLIQIRDSVIFSLNSNSPDQIIAEQDAVDNAISAIDRIAQTTRFANRKLLDGSSEIRTASNFGSGIRGISVQNAQFAGVSSISLSINIQGVASRAGDVFASGASQVAFRSATTNSVLRLSGSKGTVDISLASGAGSQSFGSSVNAFTGVTGVYASAGKLYSADYGSDETVSVEVVEGSFNIGSGDTAFTNASAQMFDAGADATARVNGVLAAANGNELNINSDFFTGVVNLVDGASAGSATSFKLQKGGLVFQLNTQDDVSNRERIGIRNTSAATLGVATRTLPGQGSNTITLDGFLSSVKSGGTNDLSTNAENALRIVDKATEQITNTRAYLGAFQKQTIESNITSLTIARENLSSSLSDIRDLDFARETAELTRNQILFQAGTSVLSQANQLPQAVLALLQ